MAITGTDRGTGGNNVSANSLACSPASTIPVGSCGVLCIALDNAGPAGSSTVSPATVTDSVGNLWTKRVNPLFDNGAASAGVESVCYTCEDLATALTSSDNVTVNFGTNVVAKSYVFHEITPTDGTKKISYVTGAAGTGATSATPSVVTSSIPAGDAVIGWGAAESVDTWAGDADTSNGSWSAHQHAPSGGTTTNAMSITSQRKIVTGTATQTYNPTLTSADVILGWIQLTEVARPTNSYANLESVARGMFRGMSVT